MAVIGSQERERAFEAHVGSRCLTNQSITDARFASADDVIRASFRNLAALSRRASGFPPRHYRASLANDAGSLLRGLSFGSGERSPKSSDARFFCFCDSRDCRRRNNSVGISAQDARVSRLLQPGGCRRANREKLGKTKSLQTFLSLMAESHHQSYREFFELGKQVSLATGARAL